MAVSAQNTILPASAYACEVAAPFDKGGIESRTDKTDGHVSLAVDDLKPLARSNDPFAVDGLFTLALQPGNDGRAAMDFLFDLYTGKEPGGRGIQEGLERDSLALVELIARSRAQAGSSFSDWKIPPKLLIMAGYAAEDGSHCRKIIQDALVERLAVPAGDEGYLTHAMLDHTEMHPVLRSDRMVTMTEVQTCASILNAQTNLVRFCEVESIPEGGGKIVPAGDAAAMPPGIYAQPIIMKKHWVLCCVDTRDAERPGLALFDSSGRHYLKDEDHQSIACRMQARFGIESADMVVQQDNLQAATPNACGVWVVAAMRQLAGLNAAEDPVAVLSDYAERLKDVDGDEKRLQVRRARARLYGEVLDDERIAMMVNALRDQ